MTLPTFSENAIQGRVAETIIQELIRRPPQALPTSGALRSMAPHCQRAPGRIRKARCLA